MQRPPRSRSSGSPPRVRGKVVAHGCVLFDVGITPACAGKRRCAASTQSPERDHPRVCGEKFEDQAVCAAKFGSPPRMRGKEPDGDRLPAERQDHPRVRGEKYYWIAKTMPPWGSPPHMRGKGKLDGIIPAGVGITPAYAGKRIWASSAKTFLRDHPRDAGKRIVGLGKLSGK